MLNKTSTLIKYKYLLKRNTKRFAHLVLKRHQKGYHEKMNKYCESKHHSREIFFRIISTSISTFI